MNPVGTIGGNPKGMLGVDANVTGKPNEVPNLDCIGKQ